MVEKVANLWSKKYFGVEYGDLLKTPFINNVPWWEIYKVTEEQMAEWEKGARVYFKGEKQFKRFKLLHAPLIKNP